MTAQQVAFEIKQDKAGAAVFGWIFGVATFWAVVIVYACN